MLGQHTVATKFPRYVRHCLICHLLPHGSCMLATMPYTMSQPTVPEQALSDAEIAVLVREFNALPRRNTASSPSDPNHWIFGLHVVPIPPPGYLVFLVNPATRQVHGEGPLRIETHPLGAAEMRERGRHVAVLLLKSFVSRLGRADAPGFAPAGWAAEDPVLGFAVGEALRRLGVREELCAVGNAGEREKAVVLEAFENFLNTLVRTMRNAGAA